MSKFKKCLALTLVLVMCISMLAGCSLFPPKTAVDLMKRSNEAMAEADNYSMEILMDIEAYIKGDIEGAEMEMEMPIEMEMSYDRAGNNMHGNIDVSAAMKASVSFMGMEESMDEDFSQSAETYMVVSEDGDEVTTYTNTDGEGWVVEEVDFEDAMFDLQELTNAEGEDSVFGKATMEKVEDEYIVTLSFADALANEDFLEFMQDNMSVNMGGDDTEIDWEAFAESVGDAEMVYTFDAKTYYLKGVTVEEFEITDLDFIEGMDGMDFSEMDVEEISMTMSMSMTFGDFGTIDADDVEVPKKVVKNAIDADDVEEEPDEPVVDEPDLDETEPLTGAVSSAWVFFYGDEPLDIPTDYAVFLNDGWYPVDDGEYGSFLCMMNDKYEDLTLYLHTNDYSGTEAYVKEHGADGFSIDVSYCDKYPKVYFAGITFGDSYDKVIATLGESDGMNKYDNYMNLEWTVQYGGKDCYLTISLTDDVVTGFDISYWD